MDRVAAKRAHPRNRRRRSRLRKVTFVFPRRHASFSGPSNRRILAGADCTGSPSGSCLVLRCASYALQAPTALTALLVPFSENLPMTLRNGP